LSFYVLNQFQNRLVRLLQKKRARYTTTINVYYTIGGSPYYITYEYSYNIELPYGNNYLDFTDGPYGGEFMEAYNYADSSTHYDPSDTYWTGSGTSMDVLWTW
jgi:hypothetical protein